MKWSLCALLLLAGILISGCASRKPKASASVPEGSTLIVTPDASLAAKVILINPTSRFVVLHFPAGQLPGLSQRFFLYHNGLKTGEVKISGPQDNSNNNIVADLVAGDAQVGDEARDQ